MNKEKEFYDRLSNWDFSMIKFREECLTSWDLYDEIRNNVNCNSIVLDLGTGGGERVINYFPEVKKIIGTDFSPNMIETARKNLLGTDKDYIEFRVMDNLKMDILDETIDLITARHTCIDAKQIYKKLKVGGKLIVRGVDKLDCWGLKKMFGKGQAYSDVNPISLVDYENIMEAGFKNVELIPIHVREYYETKEDLLALLLKTPIISDFYAETEKMDMKILDKYIEENKSKKGILLIRRYYGIVATK